MGLKVDKSPTPDNLCPRILKEAAVETADGFMVIFQNVIDSGMVPADWKVAYIVSLLKEGGSEKWGNY